MRGLMAVQDIRQDRPDLRQDGQSRQLMRQDAEVLRRDDRIIRQRWAVRRFFTGYALLE